MAYRRDLLPDDVLGEVRTVVKALKIAGIAVGSIVVLAVLLVVAVYVLLRIPPKTAAQVTPVATSSQAAQQFDTKVNSFETSVKQSAPGTSVTLTLTQEEINSKIATELSTADMPDNVKVNSVSVNLENGQILASAKVNYSGIEVNVGATAKIEVSNGQAYVVVQDLDMGKVPLPQSVKDQLTGMIPDDGKISLSDVPLDIQGITVQDGQVVVQGVTK